MIDIIIRVDYDEFKPASYRGLVVALGPGVEYRFGSGDFETDYHEALEFAELIGGRAGREIVCSGTVYDFLTDCDNHGP